MGMNQTPRMAEVFGIPTFYTTHCIIENAENGNVRIWNCTIRGGVLIPNSEVIIPARRLLEIGDDVKVFAQNVFSAEPMLPDELRH